MEKRLKSAIAVGISMLMLAIAAYLTVTTVSQLGAPPPQRGPVEPTEPSGTPTPTHSSTFFNYQK